MPYSKSTRPDSTRSARFRRPLAGLRRALAPVAVGVFAVVVAVALLTGAGPLGVPAAAAQDGGAPLPPAAFYGNVTVDGEPAPAGTEITAYVDGEKRGRLITDDPGTYGGSSVSEGKLVVNGTRNDTGATVTFRVDGELANRTATWESGAVVNLDLSVDGDGTERGSDGGDGGDESNGNDGGDESDGDDRSDDRTTTGTSDSADETTSSGRESTMDTADETPNSASETTNSTSETTTPDDGTTDSEDETSNSGGLPGFGLVLTVGVLLAGGGVALRQS